jgi:hypothetical protein
MKALNKIILALKEIKRHEEETFASADTDGDGLLSKGQIADVLSKECGRVNNVLFNSLWSQHTKIGVFSINLKEFKTFRRSYKMAVKNSSAANTNFPPLN